MTSKFNLDDQLAESYEFTYRGLIFHLFNKPDIEELRKRNSEAQVELKIVINSADEIEELPEEKRKLTLNAAGKAMVGTYVKHIEPFTFDGFDFEFSAVSEMDKYDTAGQELLGQNEVMQNALFAESNRNARNLPDYNVVALEKS